MDQNEIMEKIIAIESENLARRNEEVRKDNSIQGILYIGNIKGDDIYRITEQNIKDNYSAIIYKYFDEKGHLRGIKNENPRGEKEWFSEDGEDIDSIKDEIDKNEELIEKILEELGLSLEDLEDIEELDLEQEIERKKKEEKDQEEKDEDEKDDEEKEEEKDEKEKNKEEKEEESEEIEQTTEYKNTIKEIDTSKRIDQKGTTLGKALKIDEYSSILVIHANKVKNIRNQDGKFEKNSTKQIALLGVTVRDGKRVIEKIPDNKLQYYRGKDNESVRFDDNEQVEKNRKTTERFVIPGTNRGLAVEKSDMQTKVYYQDGIDRDDNTAVMGRVEDNNTGIIPTETKRLFNYNKGIYKEDKMNEEIEALHKHHKNDKMDQRSADSDTDTIEHLDAIEKIDDKIPYKNEILSAEKVAKELNIPPYLFIEEFNNYNKDRKGSIDLDEMYEKIEENAKKRMSLFPKKEQEGRNMWERNDSRK